MAVVLFTSAQLVTLTTMLGGLVWKRSQANLAAQSLRPARVRR